jgi:hypothetical protein
MTAINAADFADPASRQRAMGRSTRPDDQIWLDPQGSEVLAPGSGGMIDPARYEIKEGAALYRFGTYSEKPEALMQGEWWIERPELEQLIRFSEVNDRTLGYAVRLLCCVPPEWGVALNFLILAWARRPLVAWRGLGNSASATDRPRVPRPGQTPPPGGYTRTEIEARNDIPAWRLNQLFIPGAKREGAAGRFFQLRGQWQTEGPRDWLYRPG